MLRSHRAMRAGAALAAAVIWVLGAAPAPAQTDSTPPDAPAADQTPVSSGEVTIDVRQVGLRATRPGDWTGFQLEVTDSGPKARNVFVRLELPDADGDTVISQRWIVTNPGVKQSVWLYAWQPFTTAGNSGATFRLSAYEAEERPGAADLTGQDRYRPTRRIGSRLYPLGPSQIAHTTHALVAVVGIPTAGLDQYAACRDSSRVDACPTAHEVIDVVSGLKPDDLPDRWQGLAALDALVWTGREADEAPGRLSTQQAEAIREYVLRGGHLVVILPSVGQAWYGGAGGGNPLAEIMPVARAVPVEGADYGNYRELLTSDATVSLPTNAVVNRFDQPDAATAGPYEAMPLMRGAAGDTVVVRRLAGAGAVTVVGLDLARRDLTVKNALQAQQFWNRILGRRMKVLSPADLNALRSGGTNRPPLYAFSRDQIVDFDRDIALQIAKQGKAAKGLLAAFGLFLCYWLLAGPLGYFVLRQRNRRQHAWVAFTGATVLFSLLGWGASSGLKLGRDVDRHFTLLDHVYGQSNQRMRSFVELTLGRYGEQRVSVRGPEPAGGAPAWHNLLTAWEPGGETSSALSSFPDARAYIVDTRAPDSAEFPARATTRQLRIDYAGSAPSSWGMIRPHVTAETPLGQEIVYAEPGPGPDGKAEPARLVGQIIHSLPGDLREVYLIHVQQPTMNDTRLDSVPAAVPARAVAVKRTDAWPANTPLDLAAEFKDVKPISLTNLLSDIRGKPSQFGGGTLPRTELQLPRMVLGQALFPMLAPPDPTAGSEVWAVRESTHGYDLGRWFTQPCLIVIGILGSDGGPDAVECPVPVSIDNQSPDAVRANIKGITVVRWVYPLAPRPIAAGARSGGPGADPGPAPKGAE